MKESLLMVIVQALDGDSTSPPTAIASGCCNQGISFDIWRLQSFQIAQCIDLVNRCHYDVVLLADHSITH